jgi:mRNA-degrading endonuclease HigB of HigAB toxin-antitoxin module
VNVLYEAMRVNRPQHVQTDGAFKFRARIAFIKFIGSHADYSSVDALTVSLF